MTVLQVLAVTMLVVAVIATTRNNLGQGHLLAMQYNTSVFVTNGRRQFTTNTD
jgi:hypothetical protein